MNRLLYLVAVALFACPPLPAFATDAPPEPCCVLRVSPDEAQTLLNALMAADIRASVTLPLSQKLTGQAQAQIKASQDYATAHAPKPDKK